MGAALQPAKVTMLQANTVNPGVCSSGYHGGRQRLQMRIQCLEHENFRDVKSGESKLKAVLPMLLFGRILQAGTFPKARSGFALETAGGWNQPGSRVNGRVDVAGALV